MIHYFSTGAFFLDHIVERLAVIIRSISDLRQMDLVGLLISNRRTDRRQRSVTAVCTIHLECIGICRGLYGLHFCGFAASLVIIGSKCLSGRKVDLTIAIIDSIYTTALIDIMPLTGCYRYSRCHYPACTGAGNYRIFTIRQDKSTCADVQIYNTGGTNVPDDLLADHFIYLQISDIALTGFRVNVIITAIGRNTDLLDRHRLFIGIFRRRRCSFESAV